MSYSGYVMCQFFGISSFNCIQFDSWNFLQNHSTYCTWSRCLSIATIHNTTYLPHRQPVWITSLALSLNSPLISLPPPNRIGCPSVPPLRDPTELTASSGEGDIGLLRAICNSSLGLVRATDGMNHGVNWSRRMLLDSSWVGRKMKWQCLVANFLRQ